MQEHSLSIFLCAGAQPAELTATHTAALLAAAAGPVPLCKGAGGRAGGRPGRPGCTEATTWPAAQHQDEAGKRDRHLQEAAGTRGGQVRTLFLFKEIFPHEMLDAINA